MRFLKRGVVRGDEVEVLFDGRSASSSGMVTIERRITTDGKDIVTIAVTSSVQTTEVTMDSKVLLGLMNGLFGPTEMMLL